MRAHTHDLQTEKKKEKKKFGDLPENEHA